MTMSLGMMKRLDMFRRRLITQTNNLKVIRTTIQPRIKMMNQAILTTEEETNVEMIDPIVTIIAKEVIIIKKVILNTKEVKVVKINVAIEIVETTKTGKIMMAKTKKEEKISIIETKVVIVNKTTEVSTIVITEKKVVIEMKDVVEIIIKISSKENIMNVLISQKLTLTQTIGNITATIQSFLSK